MVPSKLLWLSSPVLCFASNFVPNQPPCKTTPGDSLWPSQQEWTALNVSLSGALVKTVPVASSCWMNSTFDSPFSCDAVKANWSFAAFHSSVPESIDYPVWSNNSCLPPGVAGYDVQRGCRLGGLPAYVVDAKTDKNVAIAIEWATKRNLRIAVKGTGHDMNGRSSGAYALSIWTHNFKSIRYEDSWAVPASNGTRKPVLIVGSGTVWKEVLDVAAEHGRVVVSGGDGTVGLGGFLQGGGHGPLSSTYGLGAHQILQATVATVDGKVLVANDAQNEDLFWAIRGGGGGQYGVVTEYVLQTHPAPDFVTTGSLQILPPALNSSMGQQNASWMAAATILQHIPDLMDAGLAGVSSLAVGKSAMTFFPTLPSPPSGVAMNIGFFGYNISSERMTALMQPLLVALQLQQDDFGALNVTWTPPSTTATFSEFFDATSGVSAVAGAQSIMSTRLLGRSELSLPSEVLAGYLKRALKSQNETQGTFATIGLQGGMGPAMVSQTRFGSVNPIWRSSYVHFISVGASIDSLERAGGPKKGLMRAGEWLETNKEDLWREWAPNTGAYMNEANPFNGEWKRDFYGANYEALLKVKRKYDPTESFFVLNGVGSDRWDYDLDSGKLCRKN